MSEEKNPLYEILGKLVESVNKLNEKIDGIATPKTETVPESVEAPAQKKRGRPKGSKNKKNQQAIEEDFEDEQDDDEDDDDYEDAIGEKRLAATSSIKKGRRINKFDGSNYAVPQSVIDDDRKAMELLKSGKLKRAARRPSAAMAKAICSGCGRKVKDFADNIKLTTGENGYRCNRCAERGA